MSKWLMIAAGVVALNLLSFAGLASPQSNPAGQSPASNKAAPLIAVTGGRTGGGIYDGVAIYKGIPFAAAPVGDLRWRAPQPVKAWSDTRPGTAFSSNCTQAEDCLYLNVYKPADAKPGVKLPVMVWIYGGSFTAGSSDTYDGSSFAKDGVVYVAFNYRLGRLGWFSASAIAKNAPKSESVANYGLQDQIAALKWVKTNIAKFGGDPDHVTVFGESAGAISINFLMITPQAKGLFQQAISESGFSRWEPRPLADAIGAGDTYFAGLGITGDDATSLARMRAVPFSTLTTPRMPLGAAGPINDGKLLVQGLEEGFEKGLDGKIPYMVGGNSNEASLFPTEDPPSRLAKIRSTSPEVGSAYDAVGGGDANREVSAIVTDYYITEPDRAVARLHAKHGGPTYRYFFSYVAPAQRPTAYGLGHGGELAYVFSRTLSTPEEVTLAQAVKSYWVAFAKNGAPGAAGGVAWPAYDRADPTFEIGMDGFHVRPSFLKARLDWSEKNRDLVVNSAPPLLYVPPPEGAALKG